MKEKEKLRQCTVLLRQREEGFSITKIFVANVSKYIMTTVLLLSIGIAASMWLESFSIILIFIGMTIGTTARDFGWFRMLKKNWPFTETIIDWEKVQKISDDADNSDAR